MSEVTSKHGTYTPEGVIPHIRRFGLRCPVLLDFSQSKEDGYFPPLKDNGCLVYALPGGGHFKDE